MVDFTKKQEPTKDVTRDVDVFLKNQPEELRKIRENRSFLREVEEKPIAEEDATVETFRYLAKDGKVGVSSVNLNAILKDNIRGRDVWTIDHLCKMFLEMTFEDHKKFRKKKRAIPFDMKWLLIIIIGCVGFLFIVLFILPMLGIG